MTTIRRDIRRFSTATGWDLCNVEVNYQGEYDEANLVAQNAFGHRGDERPEADSKVAKEYEKLGCERGIALFELDRFEEAEPLLGECMTFQRNTNIVGDVSPGRLKPATVGRVRTGQWSFVLYTS